MLFVPNPYQHFLTGVAFHFAIEVLALLTSTISVNAAPVPRESAACNAISDKFSASANETYKLIVGGNDITAYF